MSKISKIREENLIDRKDLILNDRNARVGIKLERIRAEINLPPIRNWKMYLMNKKRKRHKNRDHLVRKY